NGGFCVGSCNLGLTRCGDDSHCPEDVCAGAGFCTVTGTVCETNGECEGPDRCVSRVCDCEGPPPVGGAGGVSGSAGFGGVGGVGGAGGFGGGGGGSGPMACGWDGEVSSCEVCLAEVCCAESIACNEDPFCGPLLDSYSQVQCMVSCH